MLCLFESSLQELSKYITIYPCTRFISVKMSQTHTLLHLATLSWRLSNRGVTVRFYCVVLMTISNKYILIIGTSLDNTINSFIVMDVVLLCVVNVEMRTAFAFIRNQQTVNINLLRALAFRESGKNQLCRGLLLERRRKAFGSSASATKTYLKSIQ